MRKPEAQARPFSLWSLTYSTYLPTFVFAIGQGAVIPIIPLFAKDLGASIAAAAFIVALRGLGTMALDIPGGVFISKYGDKHAMLAGTVLIGLTAIGASFSPTPLTLGILILVMGGGWAFWQLARLAYVSEVAPLEHRGRALSMVGGMNRVGNFVGPAIGGIVGKEFGLEYVFYIQAACGLLASGMMFFSVEESSGSEKMEGHGLGGRIVSTMVDNKRVFLAASLPIIALGVLRTSRQTFIPLWGDSIDLDVSQIGLVLSASTFADAFIFYPVGMVMDRWGRKWVGVPSLFLLAIGFFILPAATDVNTFVLVAILTGIGNGLGAGIVMTLGADFAPDERRGEFLGVWRLIGDAGTGGGPLIMSLVIGAASLGAASVVAGGIGLAGAVVMLAFVPETLRKVRHVTKVPAPPATKT